MRVSVESLPLPDLRLLRFPRFQDGRGYFAETFRRSDVDRLDFLQPHRFPQANESHSRAGVIRGLHFQWNPYVGKLVRTLQGRMIDLVLDVRKGSPTWGQAVAVDLPANPEAASSAWIWIPPGFAHGSAFTEATTIEYFCTGEYNPDCEAAVSPLAGDIDWSASEPEAHAVFAGIAAADPVINDRDRYAPDLAGWGRDPRSENFVYGSC